MRPVLLISGIGASLLTVVFYFLPGMRDTETPGNTSRVILSDPAETMVAPAEEPDGALAGARPGQ